MNDLRKYFTKELIWVSMAIGEKPNIKLLKTLAFEVNNK
jgi:hypothetical protein